MDTTLARALAIAGAHCDLEERAGLAPPSARVRGVWMRAIEMALEPAGLLRRYLEVVEEHASVVRWYPVSEYLARLVIGGALIASPQEIDRGLFEIGRANPRAFADSLLGRALIRVLSPDPRTLLRQGVAATRQTSTYSHWEVSFADEHHAEVRFRGEYTFIDTHLLGACTGMFEAIGVDARIEVALEDRFNGVFRIRW